MKLPIIWMLLLCVVVWPAAASSQQRSRRTTVRAPAFMQRLKSFEETQFVTRAVLRNGMTILVNEFRTNPVVTLSLFVRAGHSYDPGIAPGLSALLGRVLLKGAAGRAGSPGTLGRETATLGGNLAATAGYDNLVFEISVPAMQWKKALELQAEAFLAPNTDAGEVEASIRMLELESQRSAADPRGFALRSLLELAAGPRGAGRIDLQALSDLPHAEFVQQVSAICRPSRATLVISGDIEASAAMTEVVKYYDKPAGGAGSAGPVQRDPAQDRFLYSEIRGNIRRCTVLMGFHVPDLTSADYPAVQVLAAMLASGNDSLLARSLRDRKRVVHDVDAELIGARGLGYLVLGMEVAPEDIDKAELGALTEIEILKSEPPDARDVQRAVSWVERRFWSEQQTVAGRAHTIGRYEELGDWKRVNRYAALLSQVKPADVVRVASRHLALEKCSLLEYLPSSAEARNIPADTVLKSFRELLDASVRQELAERERITELAVDAPRPTSFKFSEVRGAFRKASILRGPELFIREDHTLPLVHMGFFYPGGKLSETAENNGITRLMLRSLLSGTGDKSAGQIWRQLELYGAELVPIVEDDYFGLLFSILSQNVEPALNLVAQVIRTPKFDDDAIARQKQLQLSEIRRAADLAEGRACALVNGALFKGHPYGLPAYGTEPSVAALTPQAVREWYRSTVENRKPVVVIVGDTQGTSLAGYFVRNLSGSRFQDVTLPSEFAPALGARGALEQPADSKLSTVVLGFQGPPVGDEDGPVVDVIANLLGGDGGRLREQLEDRQALATGVEFAYRPRARAGAIAVTAWSRPENEAKVLQVIQDEIKRVIDVPLLYKDYRSALNAAAGRAAISEQVRFDLIRLLTEWVLAGKGIEGLQEYPARLREVAEEDLPDLAQRILSDEKSVTVKLRGRE